MKKKPDKKKDEKFKGKLFVVLFSLMMVDFLTTFIGVGFLGATEINIVPKIILTTFGFWWYFLLILLVFFFVVYLANINYKIVMEGKEKYWARFLGVQVAIVIYIIGVSFSFLNIINALK